MNTVRWVVLGVIVLAAIVIAVLLFLALGLFFAVGHSGGGTIGPVVTGTIAPATASAS